MGVKNDKDIASLFLALKHILQIIKKTKALFIFLYFFHVFSFFLHLKHGVDPLVRPHFEFTKKKIWFCINVLVTMAIHLLLGIACEVDTADRHVCHCLQV